MFRSAIWLDTLRGVAEMRGRFASRRRLNWLGTLATVISLGVLTPYQSRATTNSWVGTDGIGSWSLVSNWSGGLPTAGDDVFINFPPFPNSFVSSTFIQGSSFSIRSLRSNANLTIDASTLFIGGPIDNEVNGLVSLINNSTLNVQSPVFKTTSLELGVSTLIGTFETGDLTVGGTNSLTGIINATGTVNLVNGQLVGGEVQVDGATISSFELTGLRSTGFVLVDNSSITDWSLAGSADVTGSDVFVTNLDHTGSLVSSQGGRLNLTGGSSTLRSGSTFDADLTVTDGSLRVESGAVVNSGDARIGEDGSIELDSSAFVSAFDLTIDGANARLHGQGALQASGNFNWNRGEVDSRLDLLGNSTTATNQLKLGDQADIRNFGFFDWQGGSMVGGTGGGDTGKFTNESDAEFVVSGGLDWNAGTFENNGTLSLNTGAPVIFRSRFNNNGFAGAESGSLQLLGGGAHEGIFDFSGGNRVTFGGDSANIHTLRPGSQINGNALVTSGQLGLAGGDVSQAAIEVGDGAILFSLGGTHALGRLNVAPTGFVSLTNATLIPTVFDNLVNGVLTGGRYELNNASLRLPGAVTENRAEIHLNQPNSKFEFGRQEGLSGLARNFGTLKLSNGNSFASGANFLNDGSIILNSGAGLTTKGFYTQGGLLRVTDSIASLSGGSRVSGQVEVLGSGALNLNGNSHTFETGSVLKGLTVLNGGSLTFEEDADFADAVLRNNNGTVNFLGGTSATLGSLNLDSGDFGIGGDQTFVGEFFLGGKVTINPNSALRLKGGGNATGLFDVDDNSILEFGGGQYELRTGGRISGPTVVTSGRLSLLDRSTYGGSISVNGGSLDYFLGADFEDGSLTVNPQGTLNVRSGELRLNGLGNWDGASRTLNGGTHHIFDGARFSFSTESILNNNSTIILEGPNSGFGLNIGIENETGALEDLVNNSGTMSLRDGASAGFNDSINNSGTFSVIDGSSANLNDGVNNSGTMLLRDGSSGNSGNDVNNSGTMSVSSSELNVVGDYNQSAGSTLLDAGIIRANNFNITGGDFGGTGTVQSSVNNSGTFGPGKSPGKVNIIGSFSQSSAGTLVMELGGLGAGQFDELEISGPANFAGTLVLRVLDGYSPKEGDQFDLIRYSSFGGGFSQIRIEGSSVGFNVSYLNDRMNVQAVPEPATLVGLGLGMAAALRRRKRS